MSVQSEMAAATARMLGAMYADTCTVEEDSGVQGADGGLESVWSPLAGHLRVPCGESGAPGGEQFREGKVKASGVSTWLMPAVLKDGSLNRIAAKHRFTVAARTPFLARTLYVTDVSSTGGVYLKVTAKAEG
jgi:hypothetical protein